MGTKPERALLSRERSSSSPRMIVHMFFLAVVNAMTAGFVSIESDEKQAYANFKVSEAIVVQRSPWSTCGPFLCGMRDGERNSFRSHGKFCSGSSAGAGCTDGSVSSQHSGCPRDN